MCVCMSVQGHEEVSNRIFQRLDGKNSCIIKYVPPLSDYRRENLFLKALMVLAIMGAISAGGRR